MKKLKVFATPYLIWMAVFIVVPLLMVAYFAFTDEEGHFTPTWDSTRTFSCAQSGLRS